MHAAELTLTWAAPPAFVVAVADFETFALAVQRKLIFEIAGTPASAA